MLVSFAVSNFKSFDGEQTFSLVASNRFSNDHPGHLVSIPGSESKVLQAGVIYGANAAGKSNLFKALSFLRDLVLKPSRKNTGTGRTPFRFAKSDQPSEFDIQFISKGRLYRFGVKLLDEQILEEWLILVNGSKEKIIYERMVKLDGESIIEAPGFKKGKKKLRALTEVGCPSNQTFISTARALLEEDDLDESIFLAIDWFNDKLNLIKPEATFSHLGYLLSNDKDFCSFAGKFLSNASTGVEKFDVSKTELNIDELKSIIPEEVINGAISDLGQQEDVVSILSNRVDGSEFLIEKSDSHHYYKLNIKAIHSNNLGQSVPFDIKDESDGTQRLLNLTPALHRLSQDAAVYFIDEIDRSLHPILVWNFLKYFLSACNGGNRQIIVTTHESNLLDLELLRRDEVWFCEKDNSGATHMYSLAEFKIRKDLEIRKHYLQGRFGAIPFMGNVNLVHEDNSGCEK